MGNPNTTAHYLPRPYPEALTSDWRKYVIQAATPNDTRLDFTIEQKSRVARIDFDTYNAFSFGKPNTGNYGEDTDIAFAKLVSPAFPIWVEKIKVCLHQPSTYGCVKVNVWDFGSSLDNVPTNIAGIDESEGANDNIPVTLLAEYKLISNVLDSTDEYMSATTQIAHQDPFDYTIAASSYLRFGIQWAEGNAYGLKVFLIGWVLECDLV